MTDVPKRIAFRKKYMSDAITNGPLMDDPEYVEYHRADLSADLVQAGYLAGLEAAQSAANDVKPATMDQLRLWEGVYDALRATSPDPEDLAAIVARVTEGN